MLGLLVFLVAGAGSGEVVDSSESGFTSRNSIQVSASPDAVYDALVDDVHKWWDAEHTYTGDSANMSIEAVAGGCFCESLPDNTNGGSGLNGGSVQHMEVVYVEPGRSLRMRGGLGPLQAMGVAGAMTFDLEASGEGTEITLTYAVGGYAPGEGGLGALAGVVDGVVRGLLESLAHYVDEP